MQIRYFSAVAHLPAAARGLLIAAIIALALAASGAVSPVWSAQSLWVANNLSTNLEQFEQQQLKNTSVPHPDVIKLSGNPLGISFDRKKNLWITVGGDEVQEVTARQLAGASRNFSPTPTAVITSASFEDLVGSAFDKTGNLWIADASGAIFELSAAQLAAGTADTAPALTLTSAVFVSPQFVAFDKAGDLWVSDEDASSLFEFSPAQIAAGGSQDPRIITDGLAAPGELAFDRSKNLWVTNFDNSTVVEYSKTDLATTDNPAPAATLTAPNNILAGAWGLAFDHANNMWVANFTTGAIFKFGPVQLTAKHALRPKVFMGGANNSSYQITFGPTS